MSDLTSQNYIDLFNKAAGLAREGKYEESLKAWDAILDPPKEEKEKGEKGVMSGNFLGQAMMRKAWTLMDLERYEDAKKVFEDPVMEACLGQFTLEVLYEYFFSYGNTLGQLGELKAMQDKLNRAFGIAVEELEDLKRAVQVLSNSMGYAKDAENWEVLEQESSDTIRFADYIDVAWLKARGSLNHVIALRGQGRRDEAVLEAEALLEIVKGGDLGIEAEEVQDLLDSLGPATD